MNIVMMLRTVTEDHLIFREGAEIFLKKIVCFPTGAKKNNMSSMKLKK